MVRGYGIKSVELKDKLGTAGIRLELQRNRLRQFGHVLKDDWVKKCTEYPRLNGPNCKGTPKVTWLEVI